MHLPSGVGSVRDVIKDTVRSGWPQYGMEWVRMQHGTF
jgi:hypothetical protein